ncbi:hypothetical protein FKM82_022386 [Ascaphus truei]
MTSHPASHTTTSSTCIQPLRARSRCVRWCVRPRAPPAPYLQSIGPRCLLPPWLTTCCDASACQRYQKKVFWSVDESRGARISQ